MNEQLTSNERGTFEQWAQKNGFTLEVNREGIYLNTHTLDAWSAWEAALQTTECGIRNGQYRYCDGHRRDKSNRSSHETRVAPTPHHVRWDFLGWLCSVCGGWNDGSSRGCRWPHEHAPKASE